MTKTKFYVSCGEHSLIFQDETSWGAAIELIYRAMENPSGMKLGPLVMVSEAGFRSPDDMDSETRVYNFFSVLRTLGHKFRPGGITDTLFRSDFHDESEEDE